MTEVNLFGETISEQEASHKPTPINRPKKTGYAAPPGTGPEGETCKTCQHLCRIHMAKVYLKCGLMRRIWTGGPGTDIKAGAAACQKWEKKTQEQQDVYKSH